MNPGQVPVISASRADSPLTGVSIDPKPQGIDVSDILVGVNRATAFEAVTRGVVHDLRNPLQAITMAGGALTESGSEEGLGERLGRVILKAAAQLESTLQRLVLSASERGDAEPEPTVLSDVVDAVVSMQRKRPEKGDATIETRLPGDLPAVFAVEPLVKHALLNAVLNAREAAAAEGGTIVLRADHGDGVVRLSIEDNGGGIHPDIADRVFEPFFTTKPTDRHLGLGLPVAAHLAQRCGGSISVERKLDSGGTRFILLLRAVPGPV